jgi:hypothetical protein
MMRPYTAVETERNHKSKMKVAHASNAGRSMQDACAFNTRVKPCVLIYMRTHICAHMRACAHARAHTLSYNIHTARVIEKGNHAHP